MAASYTIGISNIVTVAALMLVTISMATDSWTVVTVFREGLREIANSNPALNISLYTKLSYYTRNRGLFRTCFEGGELKWLKTYKPADLVVAGSCLKETGFELEQRPDTVVLGKPYDDRKHLLRCHVSFQVLSIILLALTIVFGVTACWNYSASTLRICGLSSLLGSFSVGAAMAFFHGYEFLEKQKINAEGFYKAWSLDVPLRDYAKYEYGFSYMLGWLGTVAAFIGAVLYLIAAHQVLAEKYRARYKNAPIEKESRNRAYDYMEEQMPSAPRQSPYNYGPYHGHDGYNYQ